MEDSTQTKLINSLIDTVGHFYDLKQKGENSQIKYLKGFCEGMAFCLVKQEIIKSTEAKKNLQGLGKAREITEVKVESKAKKQDKDLNSNDLDIPTIFRKNRQNQTPNSKL